MTPNEVEVDETESTDMVVEQLDATTLLADRNTRFNLKRGRIDTLKASIAEHGILSPLEVSALTEEEQTKNKGKMYRVVFGHYRLAAALELIKEGYELTVPSIVREPESDLQRLKRQLTENMERENQSPIDKALGMRELLTLGSSKMEVREAFATPGGRKGMKSQPASNSFVNMTLSFLNFPKKIQALIHDGEIGVADAYWLTKQPADKWEAAVEKAVANRLRESAQAEEDENKFLEDEKKKEEAENKLKEVDKAVETAESEVESAIEEQKEKAAKALELYQAKMVAEGEDKKKLEAEHKAIEVETQKAEKIVAAKRAELKKLTEKAEKAKKDAEARAQKLKEARENAATASKAKPAKESSEPSSKPLRVQKSATEDVKNHPNTDGVPITLVAGRKVIKDMTLSGSYPKVTAIAKAFDALFGGHMKDKTLFETLAGITGEKAEKTTEAKPAAKKAK